MIRVTRTDNVFCSTALAFAVSLFALTACDDAPAPPSPKLLVVDKQNIEISTDAFESVLSLFEDIGAPTRNACLRLAKSVGSNVVDLKIMPEGNFDPARFVIAIKSEEDGTSKSYEVAFDEAADNCNLSEAIEMKAP
jgi:hypothetical protein